MKKSDSDIPRADLYRKKLLFVIQKISKFTEEVDFSVFDTCPYCNFAEYKGQFSFLNSTKQLCFMFFR